MLTLSQLSKKVEKKQKTKKHEISAPTPTLQPIKLQFDHFKRLSYDRLPSNVIYSYKSCRLLPANTGTPQTHTIYFTNTNNKKKTIPMGLSYKRYMSPKQLEAWKRSPYGRYSTGLQKHPFLLFGLPFIATIFFGSIYLAEFTSVRYQQYDEKVTLVREHICICFFFLV